jgi:hypothetical protein
MPADMMHLYAGVSRGGTTGGSRIYIYTQTDRHTHRLLTANAGSVPTATSTMLGVVKIGSGLSVIADGTLSYTLPIASNGILGGVKPDVDSIIVNPSTGLIRSLILYHYLLFLSVPIYLLILQSPLLIN